MRAIVVDDSPPARGHVGRMLAELGFEVFEAGNGREAVEVLDRLGEVTLVVLDWNMPDTDGIWFLHALRAERQRQDVLVLMATGNSDFESVRRALEMGANEYMMKPFSAGDLGDKLRIMGFAFEGDPA
jgi:two-component system, chemotaxis family, chemotaxis protein CheY